MVQEYVLSVLLICIDLKDIDGNGIYFLSKLINSLADATRLKPVFLSFNW